MFLCDLHAHSVFSDGTCTPEELVTLGLEAGLAALVLCDHNNVDGLPRFLAAAEGTALQAVPAVELSTDYTPPGEPARELHIVGMFIRPEHYAAVTKQAQQLLARKEESNIQTLDALAKEGILVDYWQIKAATPGGLVNRALIARKMLELGYVASIQEAFDTWLHPKFGYFKEPKRLDVYETLQFLRSIGAVPVLAHPFLNLRTPELLEGFLPGAIEAGLQAMETRYSKFSPEATDQACRIADRFGLLHSGGSDFHGSNKPDIRLGVGRGDLQIPMELFRNLERKYKENFEKR